MTLPVVRWDDAVVASPEFIDTIQHRVIAAALANLTKGPIPSLYGSNVRYQLDPVGANRAVPWWLVQSRGTGDCQDLTAWRAAELYQQTGRWPVILIVSTPDPFMVHFRLEDEDPSQQLVDAGRYVEGRRAPGPEARMPEAGGWLQDLYTSVVDVVQRSTTKGGWQQGQQGQQQGQQSQQQGQQGQQQGQQQGTEARGEGAAVLLQLVRQLASSDKPEDRQLLLQLLQQPAEAGSPTSEALLHPALQAALQRSRGQSLGITLHSGHRTISHQIRLWEDRMRGAGAGEGAPSSWAAVEREPGRYWAWVQREIAGQAQPGQTTGRPPIALPGLSDHQRRPALAADLRCAACDPQQQLQQFNRFEELNRDLVYRPLTSEPWHFVVKPSARQQTTQAGGCGCENPFAPPSFLPVVSPSI